MSSNIDLSDIIDDFSGEAAVSIDIQAIDNEAITRSKTMIDDIVALYHDEEWAKNHPRQMKRIAIELDTLRGLLKMRQADEQAHDALLNGISSNNSNAALYRALAEIQRASLSVTGKINEAIDKLSDILKSWQLDLDERTEIKNKEEDELPKSVYRGSKDFIKSMNEGLV